MDLPEIALVRQHTADLVRDARTYRLRASAPPRPRTSTAVRAALVGLGPLATSVLQRVRDLAPAGRAQACCA